MAMIGGTIPNPLKRKLINMCDSMTRDEIKAEGYKLVEALADSEFGSLEFSVLLTELITVVECFDTRERTMNPKRKI